jgi:hypothetical protein
MSNGLVIYQPPSRDQINQLLVQVDALVFQLRQLEERRRKIAARIRVFECRYIPLIGSRYSDLADLRHEVEAAWRTLREHKHRIDAGDPEPRALVLRAMPKVASPPFRPSAELRSLYRELVRCIHPDFASSPEKQHRCHEFMAEAGRAYRSQDIGRLQSLLQQWESNPDRIEPIDSPSEMLWAMRRVVQLQNEIREAKAKIHTAENSAMAQLIQQAEAARLTGFDLLAHMGEQVEEQIQQAERDLTRVQAAVRNLDTDTTRVVKINAGAI